MVVDMAVEENENMEEEAVIVENTNLVSKFHKSIIYKGLRGKVVLTTYICSYVILPFSSVYIYCIHSHMANYFCFLNNNQSFVLNTLKFSHATFYYRLFTCKWGTLKQSDITKNYFALWLKTFAFQS